MTAADRCSHCPAAPGTRCPGGDFCSWAAADPIDPAHLPVIQAAAAGRIIPGGTVPVPCTEPPAPLDPLAGIPLAGDVVEMIARRIGADRLAAWWAERTGRPCGCAERKEKMNAATRTLLRLAGLGHPAQRADG